MEYGLSHFIDRYKVDNAYVLYWDPVGGRELAGYTSAPAWLADRGARLCALHAGAGGSPRHSPAGMEAVTKRPGNLHTAPRHRTELKVRVAVMSVECE